jgi:hypothetical protein
MVSHDEAADRAGDHAEQRADDHHEYGYHEEVCEYQTADSSGKRAREQSLPSSRVSQFLQVPGTRQPPSRHRASKAAEQEDYSERAKEYEADVTIVGGR